MGRKCIICEKEATFKISGTNDYYCEECAIEYFGDLSCLVKVEDEAKKLKTVIDEKLESNESSDAPEVDSEEDIDE